MGGGGRNTTEITVPAWLEQAAQRNLGRADELSRIGYTPYYGPDVAAMTPMQVAAMQGTNAAASAFGLPTADPMAGMPAATNYGGMPAYSSGGLYDQALAELERRMPGQFAALRAPFIDPVTGMMASGSASGNVGAGAVGAGAASMPGMFGVVPAVQMRDGGRDAYGAPIGGRSTTSMATPGAYLPGGINTRNPDSLVNRMAAALSGSQGAPTAASRSMARPADLAPARTAPSRTTSNKPSSGPLGGSSGRR
jgi:hypothetical protein